MLDRMRLACKVLFVPNIIVVTKGETFSTFDGSNTYQDSKRISVEVLL